MMLRVQHGKSLSGLVRLVGQLHYICTKRPKAEEIIVWIRVEPCFL